MRDSVPHLRSRRRAVSGPMTGKSTWGLVVESLDAAGGFQTVAEVRDDEIKAAGWTPDGRVLVAWGARLDSGTVIRAFEQDGGERTIATVPAAIASMRMSSDGQWLAYDATTGGPFEVFVMPMDGKSAGPRGTPWNVRSVCGVYVCHDQRELGGRV